MHIEFIISLFVNTSLKVIEQKNNFSLYPYKFPVQRTYPSSFIHPLAIKNLRSLIHFQDQDWSNIINNLKEQNLHNVEQKKSYTNQNIDKHEKLKFDQNPSIGDQNEKNTEPIKQEL